MKESDFLYRVEQIATEEPSYKLGHDGSDGMCDCIGLIIGAIRRSGGSWPWIHGSNFAARNALVELKRIRELGLLSVGDLVFKAYEPENASWNLPERYRSGGDVRDYYHVGVVTKTDPLVITHMTTPTIKRDTTLGKWGFFGRLKMLEEGGDEPMATAKVISGNGKPVKLRRSPSTSARWDVEIATGATVNVIQKNTDWCKIQHGNNIGYMMSDFLSFDDGQTDDTRPALEKILEHVKEIEKIIEESSV